MNTREKLSYIQDNHFGDWLRKRKEVEDYLSDRQSMFCICGKLATGLHESHCRKFQTKINSETLKRLTYLLPKKKQKRINQIGKRGKANLSANKKLNQVYAESGIKDCELKLDGCDNWPLNYCHRHERDWYKGDVELLGSFNQTVIGCQHCHRKIDDNKQLREEKFLELRGPEE